MKVWRIECPTERKGPWQSKRGKNNEWYSRDHGTGHRPNDGPLPSDDCGIDICGDEHVACNSLDQLRSWFRPPHLTELAELGFVLAEYEAEPVAQGMWQVIIKHPCTHIADHSPLEAIPCPHAPRGSSSSGAIAVGSGTT